MSDRDDQLTYNVYLDRRSGKQWVSSPAPSRRLEHIQVKLRETSNFFRINKLLYRVRITHCKHDQLIASFDPNRKYMT